MPSGPISHLSEPLPSMPKSPAPESQHGGPRGYFRTFHNILDERGLFVYIALTPYTYAQTHHGHYTFCKYIHTTHTTNRYNTHTQYTHPHTAHTVHSSHVTPFRLQTTNPIHKPLPLSNGQTFDHSRQDKSGCPFLYAGKNSRRILRILLPVIVSKEELGVTTFSYPSFQEWRAEPDFVLSCGRIVLSGHLPCLQDSQPRSLLFEFNWRVVQEFQINSKIIIKLLVKELSPEEYIILISSGKRPMLNKWCSKIYEHLELIPKLLFAFSRGQWQRWAERHLSEQ